MLMGEKEPESRIKYGSGETGFEGARTRPPMEPCDLEYAIGGEDMDD